jgi:hypothetical protein
LAHFLRHSNFKPQRAQTLGSKPFLRFGEAVMERVYLYQFVIKNDEFSQQIRSLIYL